MEKEIEFKDDKVLVLHNSVIEARHDMTLDEHKLLVALVSLIKKDDNEFKEYEIRAENLINVFNISNEEGIYEITKRVADGLMQRIISIEDKRKKYWVKYSIFLKMEYKNGILITLFNPKISPFLLQLRENFTQFKLEELKSFNSKYSLRIYELLKQYQVIGERTFDINDLKLILGVENGQLKRISDFKKRILNIAQRELENTPMAFDYKMIKTGKKFTKVKFILKHKSDGTNEDRFEIENDNLKYQEQPAIKSGESNSNILQTLKEVYDLIPNEQMTNSLKKVIQDYYDQKGFDYVKNAVEYVNNQKPKNYLAYLKSTLENYYAEVIEKQKVIEEQKVIKRKRTTEIENIKTKINDFICQRDKEIERMAREMFNSMSDNEKAHVIEIAKNAIMKENPEEDLNAKDAVSRAKLNIYINETVKNLNADKFKDVNERFNSIIKGLENELSSIQVNSD